MTEKTISGIINEENISTADVVIVSAAYEKTASSHKGTVHGPAKVIECLNTQIEFFDRKYKTEVCDVVKTAHLDLGNLEQFEPVETLKNIRENCDKLVADNKFVFLLGGEHESSPIYRPL